MNEHDRDDAGAGQGSRRGARGGASPSSEVSGAGAEGRFSSTRVGRTLRRLSALSGRALRAARSGARASRAWMQRQRSSALYARWIGPLRRAARILGLALVLGLGTWLFLALTFVRIHPGEVGVRQRDWGARRGIEAQDHGPGLYFAWPGMQTWHRLDARTQLSSWALRGEGGQDRQLEIRTEEGNSARVSVSVAWRLRSGEAHAIVAQGAKLAYSRRVEAHIEKVLLDELSKQSSADFADPDARTQLSRRSLARLEQELSSQHVQPLSVSLTGVYFSGTYEKGKQENQLAQLEQVTQAALAAVKARQLENQAVAVLVDQRRQALLRSLKLEYDSEARAAEQRRLEQASLGQGQAQAIEREAAALSAQLAAEWQAAQDELELVAGQVQARAVVELEAELERAVEARRLALAQQLEREEHAADEQATTLAGALALARQRASAARQDLLAELAAAREGEELRATGETRALSREGEALAEARRAEADRLVQALEAEGEAALARAAIEGESARGEWLATEGGRLFLAREAARNLHFGRVTLDPREAGVLSPLELDGLQSLLLGGAP